MNQFHFDKLCVQIWTSVQLNGTQKIKLELNEHYSVHVPISPSEQMRNRWTKMNGMPKLSEICTPQIMWEPNHSRGQDKQKMKSRVNDSPTKVIEKEVTNERLWKEVQWTNSDIIWIWKLNGDVSFSGQKNWNLN